MLKKMLRQTLPVAALLTLVLLSWLPALTDQARDVDVLLYATAAARANAEGALPYTSTWIEKGPLAMGLYQGLFALFGPYNLAAIALTWLALALATLWMVAVLCRALGGSPWWGALLFAAALPNVGGSLNTEVPAAAAALAAVLIWLRSRQQGSGHRLVVLAGLLAGVAFLCRQNAGILAPVLVLGEFLTCPSDYPWRQRWLRPLLLAGGFMALPLLTVVLYAGLGHLDVFLFCFHSYNVEIYIAATRVTGMRLLLAPWEAVKNFLLPLPTTAALGLAGLGAALAGPGSWRHSDPVRGRARLVTALAARDSEFHYTLVFDQPTDLAIPAGVDTISAATASPLNESAVGDTSRSPAYLWKMGQLVRRADFDIFFYPAVYSYFPLLARVPCVICFHDATAERIPELLFPRKLNHHLWRLKTVWESIFEANRPNALQPEPVQ